MPRSSNMPYASRRFPGASVTSRARWAGLGVLLPAVLFFTVSGARAATELQAPVKMLMKGHNRVAVLEAIARDDGSKVAFKVRQTFYGETGEETGEEVTVRLDEATYGDVEPGKTYVVAFTNVRRNFRFRELREIDPEGFRVVGILGGGPALLDDSPAVRLLFQAELAEEPPPPAERVAAAFATLSSDDQRTRAFGVLEISLRPEWIALMSDQQVAGLRRYLSDPGFGPDLRDRLLGIAEKLPAALKGPWLAEETRRTLREIEPQFDLTTFFPRLATTAIRMLGTEGGRADGSLVARFLEANNPGVVEAALEALDRLDPGLARSRAKVILKRDDLHAESRRLLTEYLG